MIKKIFVVVSLFLFHNLVYGVDINDALKYLEENSLNIKTITRVVDEQGLTIWNANMSKITISGKSVKVKLQGVNILVITDITPYIRYDNTILLVSQGEVWIGSSESDEMNHYSTIKSLPVSMGESALFFPLGVIKAVDRKIYNIELEIQVNPNNRDSGE
ncbi:MAG: hypothetical protein DRP58_01415 [Spirochaetes bacterium]|nr:MAG: hypothetical protein DRP58_01415 [Spirochaetota bacterium]